MKCRRRISWLQSASRRHSGATVQTTLDSVNSVCARASRGGGSGCDMFSFSSLHSTGSNRYRAALSSDARFEVRILRRACVGPTRTLADAPRRPDRRAGRGLAARRFELCPLRGRAAVCGADAYRYWPTAGSFGGHWECGKKSRSPRSVERYLLLPIENLSPAAPPVLPHAPDRQATPPGRPTLRHTCLLADAGPRAHGRCLSQNRRPPPLRTRIPHYSAHCHTASS